MADSGKIGNSAGASSANQSKSIDLNTPKIDSGSASSSNNKRQEVLKQNQLYQKKSESSLEHAKNNPTENSETKQNRQIDSQLKAKNPVLAAQLEKQKPVTTKPREREKSLPPRPRLKSLLGRKTAINPQQYNPKIPERLKSVSAQEANMLSNLDKALGGTEFQYKQIADKSLAQISGSVKSSPALSEIFNFDESLVAQSSTALIKYFSKLAKKNRDPDLVERLAELIDLLGDSSGSKRLQAFLLMYFPLPLPFEIEDRDEEFDEDERELLGKDHQGEDEEDGDQDDQSAYPGLGFAQDEEEELSFSMETSHFGRIHLHLLKDCRGNLELKAKAAETVEDLDFSIEVALEDALPLGSDLSCDISTWKQPKYSNNAKRSLKISSTDKISPVLLRAGNTLLDLLVKSDEGDNNAKLHHL